MSEDPSEGITEDQYRAQLKRLGLRPTQARTEKHTIYIATVDDAVVSVPHPHLQDALQRKETIERLKLVLGITWTTYTGPT